MEKGKNNKFTNFSNKKKRSLIGVIIIVALISIIGFGLGGDMLKSLSSTSDISSLIDVDINNTVAPNEGNMGVNGSRSSTAEDRQFFCGNQTQGPSNFINEYRPPLACSQPLGLVIDNHNNIWITSGKTGHLFVFDPKSNTFNETIPKPKPNWPMDRPEKNTSWQFLILIKGDSF